MSPKKLQRLRINNEYYLVIDPNTKFWALVDVNNYDGILAEIQKIYDKVYEKLRFNLEFWKKSRSQPLIVHFEVHPTGRCNLRCKYCYMIHTNNTYKNTDMDRGVAEKIFYKISEYIDKNNIQRATITFHGGEPLLKKDLLMEIIDDYHKDPRFVFDIQTNGTLLDEDAVKYFHRRGVKIGISIDGPREIHNKTRVYPDGKGSYDNVLNAIHTLRKYYQRLGGIVTITRFNVNHLDVIIEQLYKLGFYSFFMNPVIPPNKSLFYLIPDIKNLIDGYKKAINKVIKINLSSKRKIYISNISALLMNIFTDDQPCTCYETPCGAARAMLVITPNGDTYPCSEFITRSEFKLGNIVPDSIDEILTRKPAVMLRNRTVDRIAKCSTCPFKYICSGNCPFSSLVKHGSLYKEPLYCDFYYNIIIYLFELISKFDKKIIDLLIEGRDRAILSKRETVYDVVK